MLVKLYGEIQKEHGRKLKSYNSAEGGVCVRSSVVMARHKFLNISLRGEEPPDGTNFHRCLRCSCQGRYMGVRATPMVIELNAYPCPSERTRFAQTCERNDGFIAQYLLSIY